MPMSLISRLIQSNRSIVWIRADNTKALWVIILLYALSSEDNIFLVRVKYSFETLPLLIGSW